MRTNWNLIKYIVFLELRSIIRNKYLRLTLLHNYLFILLGLYIISGEVSDNESLIIFWTILLVSMPTVQISNIGFSKDASFFNSIFTRNIPMEVYVKGKNIFTIIYSSLFYLVLLPFLLNFDRLALYTFAAGVVYYINFGGMLMLYLSSFDKHKINLNKSPFFNYEGFSILKIILVVPIMSPLFFLDKTRYLGIGLMFFVGILGLFLHKLFVKKIAHNLESRKYALLNNL